MASSEPWAVTSRRLFLCALHVLPALEERDPIHRNAKPIRTGSSRDLGKFFTLIQTISSYPNLLGDS
jgi:hypothetical protein